MKVIKPDGTEISYGKMLPNDPTKDQVEAIVQQHIGRGMPLHVTLFDKGRTIDGFVNETAAIDGQPVNERATKMLTAAAVASGHDPDPKRQLHGPVVIFRNRIWNDKTN